MAQAGIVPSAELEPLEPVTPEEEERLSAFRDFFNGLEAKPGEAEQSPQQGQ